jgi:hypothetical protein
MINFCKICTLKKKLNKSRFYMSKMFLNRRIKFFASFFSKCYKYENDVIDVEKHQNFIIIRK